MRSPISTPLTFKLWSPSNIMKPGDIVEVHSRVEVKNSTFIDHGILLNEVPSQDEKKCWHGLVSEGSTLRWDEQFLVAVHDKRYLIDEAR